MNVRAPSYLLLQATHRCMACSQPTAVYALAVPPGHECTEADFELDESQVDSPGLDPAAFQEWLFSPEQWHRIPGPAVVSQVRILSPSVAQAVQAFTPHYRPNDERRGQWTSFCAHCGKAISEGPLYATAGEAFSPKDAPAASQIQVHETLAPFEAFCDMFWTDSYRNKWPLFTRLGYPCDDAD